MMVRRSRRFSLRQDTHITEYYFTYALVLAHLNRCGEALQIAQLIQSRVPSDDIAMTNAAAAIQICQKNLHRLPTPAPANSSKGKSTPVSSAATSTPVPQTTSTPIPPVHCPHAMNISPRRPLYNRRSESNVYRMFFWALLLLGGVWLLIQMRTGKIESPFQPTPTPTRTSQSFALEGDAEFTAGQVDAAINSYKQGTQVDPSNAELLAKLARIQTYSSQFLLTDAAQNTRLQEALASANQAVSLAPDDSTVYAIRAFVLDWNANPSLVGDKQAQDDLLQADQDAVHALQLDNTNTLALAFYAEILVDEQKWTQAEQEIKQAVDRDPSLMDVHRVYAYVLESLGEYNQAIQEYDKAIAIAPNLTFLYLRAGANYRRLGFASPNDVVQKQLFESSLEYFAKAVAIDKQLGIQDPVPYLSIAKTYSQEGEYFIAARNVQVAIQFQPDNPDLYGQLGIIYQKSRNYEGAIPALKCAIKGCTAQESCDGRGGCGTSDVPTQVTGLPLSDSSLPYYYTYGSIVAALSRPDANNCPDAVNVLQEVSTKYGGDPTVAGIVQSGDEICQSLGTTTPLTARPLPSRLKRLQHPHPIPQPIQIQLYCPKEIHIRVSLERTASS